MAQLLELAQLLQPHDVPEVDVRAAGIEPLLQPQRLAGFQEFHHLLLNDNLRHATFEQ